MELGAEGFLCGTIDECEMAVAAGAGKIMYAYPPANPKNISRLAALAHRASDLAFGIEKTYQMLRELGFSHISTYENRMRKEQRL